MKKEIALSFSSLAIAVLLVIGVGEIALRIRYGATSLPREMGGGFPAHMVIPDEKTGYTLTPNFSGRQIVPQRPDVTIQINRYGLRDYERELPCSKETILVLGDSFAFGHGMSFEETWPALLENKIQRMAPQSCIVKAGVPGFGWHQYFQQYERLHPHLGHPGLVIVAFTVDAGERITGGYVAKGGVMVKWNYPNLVVLDGLVYEKSSHHEWINRIDSFLRSRSYFFRWFNQRISFVYHQSKRAIRQRLEKKRAEEPNPQDHLMEQRFVFRHAAQALNSIYEMAKGDGAKMLVLFIDYPNGRSDEIAYYEKFLSQKGIPSLDLSKYEGMSSSSWRLPQDAHWNALGNQEVAETVYQFIREKKLLKSLS